MMVPEGLDQGRFPRQRCSPHGPLRAGLPGVIAAGPPARHLTEPPHRVVAALGGDEAVAAHGVGVTEKMAMAFFKISSSCACHRAKAHSWRSSAVVSGSRAVPDAAATSVWAAFCHG